VNTAPSALQAKARAWIADDPDPETRAELTALLDAGETAELAARFCSPLAFGTAGIRGPMGAGPARMNRAVVRRITAGLAARLLQEDGAAERGVVIGRDARHGSVAFLSDVGAVLAGAGLRVRRFDGHVPTPLVSFAVRHLDAAAGVQVTASHNPPADNGYKVYWSGGGQIVAPLDAEIAEAAASVPSVSDLPVAADAVEVVEGAVTEAYLQTCLALTRQPQARDLRIVYTPLHGVARDTMLELLSRAGFGDVHVVAAQGEPDPDFPTVTFPNPEEPGALDLALDLAREIGADLVLANDPDGDRIAVAVADAGTESGWLALNGDQVGCLLGDYLLESGDAGDAGALVATTVVSSRLLSRIALHHGVRYAETLTGFKWLAAAAAEAERTGGRMVLGYEQALGAMCGEAVRDKDGISAALVFAELAAVRKAAGSSVLAALDELALRHGVHHTLGRSVRLDGPDGDVVVARALARLREEPPTEVEGLAVVAREDRAAQTRVTAEGEVTTLGTPPTDLYGLELADGSRLQVRPSGTEPLLKFYVEAVEPVTDDDVPSARDRAAARADRLADAFVALAV
jgi:phosphomannomutase